MTCEAEHLYNIIISLSLSLCVELWRFQSLSYAHPLLFQRKYGCHRPRVPHRDFNNHLTERICVYCSRRRPVPLEELAVLVLLRNIELLKKADFAQSHHPQRIYWIIGRAINANLHVEALELAQFIPEDHEPSLALFDVEPDKEIILKRFLFYSSVYHKLKAHVENPSNLIDRIIEYLADFDNDYYGTLKIVQKHYYDYTEYSCRILLLFLSALEVALKEPSAAAVNLWTSGFPKLWIALF